MAQAIVFIRGNASKGIRLRQNPPQSVIGIGNHAAFRIRHVQQIARRGIGICRRIAVRICLRQHSSLAVISKTQAVLQSVADLCQTPHGIVPIYRFRAFLIRYRSNFSCLRISKGKAAIVPILYAGQAVQSVVFITPPVSIGIRIGNPVSVGIILVSIAVSLRIRAACQAVHAVIRIYRFALQRIRHFGAVSVPVVGKGSLSSLGIHHGKKVPASIVFISSLVS